MKRDEASSLDQLLNKQETIDLICVSQLSPYTEFAGIRPGQRVTLLKLYESGDQDDILENLDPAFILKETELMLSYMDFEMWYQGFNLEDYKRMTRKKHLI